ncbi:MAG: GNAT family N-acetyltransferase [Chloroflexota bacterium]
MTVTLSIVLPEEKSILAALMQLYMYESTAYTDDDINPDGTYTYYYLDHYWQEEGRFPFLIYSSGRLAGLALVRTLEFGEDPYYQLAEFFILHKYRRQGVGRTAAVTLFNRFQGRWEVQQEAGNLAGQAFWRRIIGDYTAGDYIEEWRESEHHRGPTQLFVSQP